MFNPIGRDFCRSKKLGSFRRPRLLCFAGTGRMTEDQLWHPGRPYFFVRAKRRSNIIQRISRGLLAFFLLPLS